MISTITFFEWETSLTGLPSRRDLEEVEKIYCASFPPEERMDWNEITYAIWEGSGRLDIARLGGEIAGFAFTEHLNVLGYHFLSYLAVNPRLRSRGLGGWMLNNILQMAMQDNKLGIIFDVEHPHASPREEVREVRLHRLEFYFRNGAQLLSEGWDYRVPVMDHYILRHLMIISSPTYPPPSQEMVPDLVRFIMTELYRCPINDPNLLNMLHYFDILHYT